MPENWLDVARDARKASNLLASEHYRSCVSRAYYAAYSKVAHELVFTGGMAMPAGREGPNHTGGRGSIRRLIETSMPNMTQPRRHKLSELIGRLYTLRIDADYHPSRDVDVKAARAAVTMMQKVFESF